MDGLVDAFHWTYRSCLKKAYDETSDPPQIQNNKELYNFSESSVPKEHGKVRFEFFYEYIESSELEAKERQLKLIEKKSDLPLTYRKKDGMAKTLHLLEAIVSLKYDRGMVYASTSYSHENPDKWSLLDVE